MSAVSKLLKSKTILIFDLFHTLTGYPPWKSVSVHEILGVDRESWYHVLADPSHPRFTGELKEPLEIMNSLIKTLDKKIPEEKVREAIHYRMDFFRDYIVNIPRENIDTLKQLRENGFRLALLSNADEFDIAAWEDSPLSGLFDCEIFSCRVGVSKPNPAIYRKALDCLEADVSEAVFVGDGGSDELKGAKDLGLNTVMMTGIIERLWKEAIEERRAWADVEMRG